jgi:hypothetical protein
MMRSHSLSKPQRPVWFIAHVHEVISHALPHITLKNILHTKLIVLSMASLKLFFTEAVVLKTLFGVMAAIPVMAQAANTVGIDLSNVEPIPLLKPVVITATVGNTPQEREAFLIEQQILEEKREQERIEQETQANNYQRYIDTLEIFYASNRTLYPDWMKPHMPEYAWLLTAEEIALYTKQHPLAEQSSDADPRGNDSKSNDSTTVSSDSVATLPSIPGSVSMQTSLQGWY